MDATPAHGGDREGRVADPSRGAAIDAVGSPGLVAERILLFIPCYNCEKQVARVLAQLDASVVGFLDEVLIVDNRSGDATVERASAALPAALPATVVRNVRNYHLGGSHKVAFAYAKAHGFSHVLVLHGDDQADVWDMVDVLARGLHRGHDACLGARFMPGARLIGYSLRRTLGNRVFNLLFTLVTGRRVRDLGSGLNLFSRAVFTDPAIIGYADDLRFNVYLLLGLLARRRRLLFVPISWREDDQVSNVRLASQAARTLGIAWGYLTRRARFLAADHRDDRSVTYAYDVVARHAVAGASHG